MPSATDVVKNADLSPLAPGARVVTTHAWRDAPPAVVGLLRFERARRFGGTALVFYRWAEPGPPAEAE